MKTKDYLLHLNHLRKFVGYEAFCGAIKSRFKLEIIDKMPIGNALVLSPHPDDDVFGCGGAIKMGYDAGNNIKIVYFYNGDGSGAAKEREAESRKAAAVLGITDLDFWQMSDSTALLQKGKIEKLKSIIENLKPATIYAPSFLDPHPDHLEAARLLAATLRATDFNGMIFSYEIWTPILANRLVSIDKVIETKKEAILAHRSQLKDRNYEKAIIGLAQYRAGMFNAGQYAEAFFVADKDLYLELFSLVYGEQK